MKWQTFTILICASLFIGCSTLPTADEHRAQLQEKLRTVVVEDGIVQQEADIIAENYFRRFTPVICGSVERVVDGGTFWIAQTYFGVAPMLNREPIRIDKKSGRVTWSDGPTIENPKMIW